MKIRSVVGIAAVLLVSSLAVIGQNRTESFNLTESDYREYPHWQDMMMNRNVNFHETQKAFYTWWENRVPEKGMGYSVFKRWEHYWYSRVNPDGSFPEPDHVVKEYTRYIESHPQSRLKTNQPEWKELGPRDRITPLGYMGIGRVNAIAFDPADTSKIYLGAPSGGFWISEDSGATWKTTSDTLPTMGVSAILIHPENPEKILIGTGDRDGGNDWGVGCMISLDGGSSWNITNEGMEERTVGMFAQHESNPDIVFAATNGAIYKTENFGESWEKVSPNEGHENFRDIKYKPGDMDILYATSDKGFYRSSNGGISWINIGEEYGFNHTTRTVIGVSPANNNLVYLVTGNTFKGCFRSEDSGQTFTLQSDSPNILGGSSDGDDDRNQSWYDLVIFVDPFNPRVVHTGGINMWRSDDAGVTWKCTGHWTGDGANLVHADHHTIAFNHLNNRMYLGNDGGIYYTDDRGESWTDISPGLGIGQMYKLGVSATNKDKFLAGFQDNGTATHTPDGWKTTGGGDGFECMVDPYTDQYSYTSIYYGNITRREEKGSPRQVAAEDVNGITEKGAWVTPYRLSEWDSNTMIIGYKNIWVCRNIKNVGEIVWRKISDNLGGANDKNCRVVETSPADSSLLYVARHDSKIFRTDNLFPNPDWIELTSSKPIDAVPSDFECHPYDAHTVYMTIGRKVFKSYDRGESWENISGSLPEIPINNIEYDRSSDEGLYIATDAGVYYKNAAMDDWILYGIDLPASVEVTELEIYYDRFSREQSRLRVSTYGRGMWEISLAPTEKPILPPYLLYSLINPWDIELLWSTPYYPSNVVGYNVYRNGELIATTGSNSFLDIKADRKIFNSYKVSAVYRLGEESGFTNTIEIPAPISLPYKEDFEAGHNGWNAKFTPDGWNFGTADDLNISGNNGLFFGINSAFVGENIHVNDYLITPSIDLNEYQGQTIRLSFDYTLRRYMRFDKLKVLYRQNVLEDWIELENLEPGSSNDWEWKAAEIELPEEALVNGMQIGFFYDDSNEHAWGAGIDEVKLSNNSTSILEIDFSSGVEVFPNPNNGNFDIKMDLKDYSQIKINVRDILGRKVWENKFVPGELNLTHRVSLNDLEPGIYQLAILIGKTLSSHQIIIQ